MSVVLAAACRRPPVYLVEAAHSTPPVPSLAHWVLHYLFLVPYILSSFFVCFIHTAAVYIRPGKIVGSVRFVYEAGANELVQMWLWI